MKHDIKIEKWKKVEDPKAMTVEGTNTNWTADGTGPKTIPVGGGFMHSSPPNATSSNATMKQIVNVMAGLEELMEEIKDIKKRVISIEKHLIINAPEADYEGL